MIFDIPSALGPILQIIWIDIVLSGDNAVVIGLACRGLPERQRYLGLALGTGTAVLLRILLTIVVVKLLALSFVRLIGGVLLILIAIKLATQEHGERDIGPAGSVSAAIRIIVVADAVMSLDNVMAIAAAAKGSILLVIFGLALSVPLIIFGSTLLIGMFSRFPSLVWAGAGLLGYVAGELIAAERVFQAYPITHAAYFETACGVAGIVLVLVIAFVLRRLRGGVKAG
ncbi:MAG TPA: TerC family protein [Methylovirgula sp.]